MCHNTIPKPIVRSILPAAIGASTASDSSAMMALLSIRALAFAMVGKVSGNSAENSKISSTPMICSP